MERMTVNMLTILARRFIEQAFWGLRRFLRAFTRRFGVWGWGMLVLWVVAALVGWTAYNQKMQGRVLASRLSSKSHATASVSTQHVLRADMTLPSDGRIRLKAFEDFLLPDEDIPGVVQEVLRLAEEESLSIQRGEYRPQIDQQGKFMRYCMNLPVKGAAAAIHRFVKTALRTQKNLALDSVQFKRERIESDEIEARIQWVIVTRVPAHLDVATSEFSAEGER